MSSTLKSHILSRKGSEPAIADDTGPNLTNARGRRYERTGSERSDDLPGKATPSSFGSEGKRAELRRQSVDCNIDSITNSLSEHFRDPVELIKGMARSNMIISGSRALRLLGGTDCCDDGSDYDFYVYGSLPCVGRALDVLVQQDVKWRDFNDTFRELLDASADETRWMSTRQLKECIVRNQSSLDAKDDLWRAFPEILSKYSEDRCRVMPYMYRIGEHGILDVQPNPKPGHQNCAYGSQPKFDVITGYTSWKQTNIKVQLIFCMKKSPLEFVMDFYASHVQCAITPYGAIHFDWENAKNRQGVRWPKNSQAMQLVPKAFAKYKGRGWNFVTQPSGERILGTTSSSNVKVVVFNIPLGIDRSLEDVRRRAFDHLTWEGIGGATSLLKSDKCPRLKRFFPSKSLLRRRAEDVKRAEAHTLVEATREDAQAMPESILVL